MAVDTLTPSEILNKIRWEPLLKKGSVYDVIQLVTGCAQGHASQTFKSILDKFDVSKKFVDIKFKGRGQRLTPVAHLKDLIEIAWLCPGKNAKEFRRTGAVTMCRALGGDLSLVEEIKARRGEVSETEQAALLAGTGVSAAEANGQALAVRDDEFHERMKRMRLENDMLEVQIKDSALSTYERLKRHAEGEEDALERLFLKDAAHNYIQCHFPTTALLTDGSVLRSPNAQISISTVATEMGLGLNLRVGRKDVVAGRIAAGMYRQKYGEAPPKHPQLHGGQAVPVNSYTERDRDLIEAAIREAVDVV